MSLTSLLANRSTPLREWFETTLPDIRFMQVAYRQSGPVTVVPPSRCAHGTIGCAFDYRVRYYFALTDPAELVASHGAVVARAGELYRAVASELARFLERVRPVGSRLAADDEATLNRFCFSLALFEECYRAGLHANSPLVPLLTGGCVDEVLAIPNDEVIADLCALSFAFADAASDLVELRDRTVLNPIFRGSGLVGGADADLIVDGCLYDLKTSKQPGLSRETAYQLIGYALLDFDDTYGIHSVGLYRARVPVAVTWELAEVLATAGGPVEQHDHTSALAEAAHAPRAWPRSQ